MKVRRARLDADRKAKPRTVLIAHFPVEQKIVGHSKVIRYELRDCGDKEG